MPVLTFETLDSVPDGLKDFAKSDGDKITVNVVPEVKLSEFRDNNIAVSKERDDLLLKVDRLAAIVGEDPEAFEKDLTELRSTRDRVLAGDLKESRALEEAIGKRTEEMRNKFQEELQSKGREGAAWRTKYEQLDNRHKQTLVIQAIKDAAVKADSGVEPSAINAVAREALDVFRVTDDARIIPMNGDAPIYGANGVDPMTPSEWLLKLREASPFYFKQTAGGGAGGDSTKKSSFGLTHTDLMALSPEQKLALANKEPGSRP